MASLLPNYWIPTQNAKVQILGPDVPEISFLKAGIGITS